VRQVDYWQELYREARSTEYKILLTLCSTQVTRT